MAAELNAPTDIALTFVDYLSIKNQNARRFEQLTSDTLRFIQEIERVADKAMALFAPPWFRGVGQFYEDFGQVSDQTVRDLLARAAKRE